MKPLYDSNDTSKWQGVTDEILKNHPLKEQEIVDVVLKSWSDIFNSKIGSFSIGKDIYPTPQIMSFFLHELVAHYLSLKYNRVYKVGVEKHEKDIHHLTDASLSVEIKGSSHKDQIFGNRSYAQPSSTKVKKSKEGYYITINFEKFTNKNKPSYKNPKIVLIRFGYLEHTDWIAQSSATGQQATLKKEAYQYKLKTLYFSK